MTAASVDLIVTDRLTLSLTSPETGGASPTTNRVSPGGFDSSREMYRVLKDNLLAQFIRAYFRPGEIVLDPFAGSGSTAVAAK